MGFSKPKAVAPAATPPPVTTNSADVAQAQLAEERAQEKRFGYQDSINPSPSRRTLLSKNRSMPMPGKPGRQTLLSSR